jgi:transcriptional regulator with XRE-family HTH domain
LVHTNKIKGRMVELGITQKDIANALGVATSTVSQKINNVNPMTVREAFIISEILNIPDEQFKDYFYNNRIA